MEYFGEEPAAEITNKKGGDIIAAYLDPKLSKEEIRVALLEEGLEENMVTLLLDMRAQ